MGITFIGSPGIPSKIRPPMNGPYDAKRLAVIILPIVFSMTVITPLIMASTINPELLQYALLDEPFDLVLQADVVISIMAGVLREPAILALIPTGWIQLLPPQRLTHGTSHTAGIGEAFGSPLTSAFLPLHGLTSIVPACLHFYRLVISSYHVSLASTLVQFLCSYLVYAHGSLHLLPWH